MKIKKPKERELVFRLEVKRQLEESASLIFEGPASLEEFVTKLEQAINDWTDISRIVQGHYTLLYAREMYIGVNPENGRSKSMKIYNLTVQEVIERLKKSFE